jgi:glycosyltransferase involved in cell wall biosynthesis
MDNEIRTHIPMIYYHVWDNYPYPKFNRPWYSSNDHIACISKLTHDIVQTVVPEVDSSYIPHAVDGEIFKPIAPAEIQKFKQQRGLNDRFVCFWNNRNARRKQSGTLIFWFKEFLDKVGHDKATLIMHTDPKDVHGQDLEAIIHSLDLTNGEVLFSREKVQPQDLAMIYNVADLTINIADAEGFGLATLESLSSGTPILINMTGGLQDQITDGETCFGIGLEPTSKAIIGSQDVPYIYEDRINKEEFLDALTKLYEMTPAERNELGLAGRKWAETKFNFETFTRRWDELFTRVYEEMGSWEDRKNYSPYTVKEF